MNNSLRTALKTRWSSVRTFVQTCDRAIFKNRPRTQRGEGVISLAIGVLIIAFLGAGMWLAFNSTLTQTQSKVDQQVQSIGG